MKITRTKAFKRDFKLSLKRGKSSEKFIAVLELLIAGKVLPVRYRDHRLSGNYSGRRECHIEPDWLLIYQFQTNEIILERIGTHADLFR